MPGRQPVTGHGRRRWGRWASTHAHATPPLIARRALAAFVPYRDTMRVPRIQYYTDGRHPLIYMYEPPMQPEEIAHVVDELAGTPVQALHICLGDGRTVLHDSAVAELWGANVDAWPHVIFHRAHRNGAQVRGYFLVFELTIREIRDFYREMYRTNRESVTVYQLIRRGHDPMRVVCERGRELGIQVVAAVLMNQVSLLLFIIHYHYYHYYHYYSLLFIIS
eukprot:SAG31_NODE_1442_length_8325_cov_5.564916_7_plen_221_part_00